MSSSVDAKNIKSPHELLGMETALLVATAASRKIDVSVWFGEKASDGKILVRDFDSKIMSLASAMGINQDQETKRELELATSTLALRMVHTLCAAGEDEHGQIFIDVSYFFKLCQEKVDKYLAEIEEEPEDEGDDEPATSSKPLPAAADTGANFREWKEGAYDIHGNPIDAPEETNVDSMKKNDDEHDEDSYNSEFEYRPHDEDSEDYDIVHLSAEDYITDLKTKANEPRPKSAPVGSRALSRGETISETFQPTNNDDGDDEPLYTQAPSSPSLHIRMTEGMHWNESKITPASPYDEEVEFGDEEEHDEDFDSNYVKSRGSNKLKISLKPGKVGAEKISKDGKVTNPDANTDWTEENRKFLMVSKEKPLTKPRPSSAPRMGGRNTASAPEPAASARQQPRSKSTERLSSPSRRSLTPSNIIRSESPKRRSSVGSFGPHLKKSKDLPLTLDQMASLKDVVEDLVRDTVKKTDCYHLIQVSLGYIDSYTMVPPRGAIVMSTKREWLANREIHSAFISGRLFLQENHIKALKLLVNDFAKQYRKMYVDKANKMIKLQDELEEKLPGHVIGPSHALNAEWLKRYLVHLRLTKRIASHQSNKTLLNTSSIASKSIGLDTSDNNIKHHGNDDKSEGSQENEKVPIMWKEWLAKKLKHEIERGPLKPKDFQRALNGQNHPLNKDDIEYLLKSHPILTQEALMQEIEYRIESWVLDTDGRRDFQHQLNVKIRTWIWDEMVLSKAAKLPKNEHGYWRIWQKLPEDNRKEVKESLIKKLVDEKREELKSAERTRMEVTKSLFWQFDASRRDRECPWTEWLPNHLEKFRKNLDKFKKNEEERLKIASKQKKRRKSMASLQAIEANLKDVGKSLDAHHQMQLQKGVVSLRRAARENGLGKGGIITKEDFDAHIKGILEPYISLNDTFVENYTMDPNAVPTNLTKFAEEWRNKINALFTSDPDLTLQRATEDHDNYNNTNKVSYKKWLEDKKKRQLDEERRKIEEKEREERDKEMRKRKSEKAYKKWLRLRKQNKYKSMVDSKTHDLPVARRADHHGRWNYDKESIHAGAVDESNPKLVSSSLR